MKKLERIREEERETEEEKECSGERFQGGEGDVGEKIKEISSEK